MSQYNILGVEPNFKLEGTNLGARYTAEFTPDHLDEIARRADEMFAEQLEGQIFERVAHLRGYVKERECRQVLSDCNDGLLPPFVANCSKCGEERGYTPNYCPNCGAKVVSAE